MSPLLRALTFSRAAREPVTQGMLLQSYTALDAFRRGYGSQALFATLGRQLLASGELCHLGFEPDALAYIENAHAAMVRLDAAEHQDGSWQLGDSEYAALCVALGIFDAQLAVASLNDIANAEAKALEGLLRADVKEAAVAEHM
jgi:hypothetical protein